MARKAGRNGARAAVAESGEGVLAGIVDRVFEDPARSGGLMVVAMTATAIICNAMFLQNSHRPAPLFATRPSASAVPLPTPAPDFRPAATPAPAPQAQPVQRVASPQAITPPLPRPAPSAKPAPVATTAAAKPAPVPPAPVPATATQSPSEAQQQTALVTEIQRGLARLGIYTGAIDGKTGGRTSAAIAKYETAAGLKPTGHATPELLYALQHPTAAPAAAAAPAADPIAAQLDSSAERRAASIAADNAAADAKAAAAAKAQAQAQAAQAQAAKAAAQTKAAGAYRTVQTALNRIGYGPVPVDGTANSPTVDAIRRFELDNGLPVSGEPSDALTTRLVAIGAMKSN